MFSAITPYDRRITTGKDQIISCDIAGLESAATIKWIDPDGTDISAGDSTNYIVEAGNFSGGAQTTKLTLKSALVATFTAAKTYECSVSSGEYRGSGVFKKDVVVTPIGGL